MNASVHEFSSLFSELCLFSIKAHFSDKHTSHILLPGVYLRYLLRICHFTFFMSIPVCFLAQMYPIFVCNFCMLYVARLLMVLAFVLCSYSLSLNFLSVEPVYFFTSSSPAVMVAHINLSINYSRHSQGRM